VWRGRLKLVDFSGCLIKKKWRFGFKQTPDYGIITQRAKRLWLFLGSQLAYKKQNEVNRDARSLKLNKNMCD